MPIIPTFPDFLSCLIYLRKVKVLVSQLCPTLCDPMDYSPPGSSAHGIFQARILEWDLPDPGTEPVFLVSPAVACVFFTSSAIWGAPPL